MFERFTDRARKVMQLANQEALRLNHEYLGTEHILLGLVKEGSGGAANVLKNLGVDLRRAQQEVEKIVQPGTTARRKKKLVQTPSSNRIIEHAMGEARKLEHNYVGTEHLLLGLLRVQEGVAAQVLMNLSLKLQDVREEVLNLLGHGSVGTWNGIEEVDHVLRPVPGSPPGSVHPTGPHDSFTEIDSTTTITTLRILDAAANRAREGLRVVEDYVRFSLDDAQLTGLLKLCRHNLTAVLQKYSPTRLTSARQTEADVGTGITTKQEHHRETPLDVVQANFKRVQEALRTLEEFSKVNIAGSSGSSDMAAIPSKQFEAIRYELYTIEKAVLNTQANRERLVGGQLYLLLIKDLCRLDPQEIVRQSIDGGVAMVQVREKAMADRELLNYAKQVREWTLDGNALMIVNDRPDIAVLAKADGVHVGQEELTVHEARRIVGPDFLVGVSTHTIEQARQAVRDGADYLGVGPVFDSTTKSFSKLAGLEFVRQVAAEITLPWYAIGGITADNAAQVTEAGAKRIAVSSALCTAEHPATAARTLLGFFGDRG